MKRKFEHITAFRFPLEIRCFEWIRFSYCFFFSQIIFHNSYTWSISNLDLVTKKKHKLQYLHSATEFKQATINDAKFVENLNLKKEYDEAEKWWGNGIVPWSWRLWLSLSVRLRREILKRKSGFCFGGFDLIGISPMSFLRENYDLGLKSWDWTEYI